MLQYLYKALASKWGIALTTNNIVNARARLYKARAESGDTDLSRLQFRPNPHNPSELWIVKGEQKDAEEIGEGSGT